MLVVDASVLAVGLLDGEGEGARVRSRLRGEELTAPGLVDLEVVSVWRRLVLAGMLDAARAAQAIEDLRDLPLQRVHHDRLLWRCWELRENLSVYDAACVALAEALDATLLTGDRRLARAPGVTCRVEVVDSSPGPHD